MRYNRYLYRLSLLAVPITDTVKMSISVADISADPIIGTPLVGTMSDELYCYNLLIYSILLPIYTAGTCYKLFFMQINR